MGGLGKEGAVGTSSIGRYHSVFRNFFSAVNFISSSTEDYITFKTHKSGVSVGERMRISADGNVGIGTTSPSTKLVIENKLPIGTNGYGDNDSVSVRMLLKVL